MSPDRCRKNTEKITPEMMRRERLVFYPATQEEAAVIQERLIAMGGKWGGEHGANAAELENCVQKGFLCERGTFYYNPSSSSSSLLCTVNQLDENYMPPDRAFLMEQFNKMTACIEGLTAQVAELKGEVAALKAELYPGLDAGKSALKKPSLPQRRPK